MEQINLAAGEAEAILLRSQATSHGIESISRSIGLENGHDAVSLSVAEKYVEAFGRMAKEGTTLIVPAAANDAASMVTQALTIYSSINKKSILNNQATAHSTKEQTSVNQVDIVKKDESSARPKDTETQNWI